MRGSWRQQLARWATGSALDLAVMRIVVGLLLLTLPELHEAPALAETLAGTRLWGPLCVDPTAASACRALAVAGCALGIAGIAPRTAFAVATASATYLLAIPQQLGATLHFHHLVWLSALLATAPSADALSPTAPTPWPRSVAHGLPVRLAWGVLGLVYLFPGLHKLLAAGPCWDPTDHLYWKWAQSPAFVPLFAPGEATLRAGGTLVVLFELLFAPAILLRPLRLPAAAAGLLFHAATAALFDIRFSSLWWCYAVLVPWEALAAHLRPEATAHGPAPRRTPLPTLCLGAPLLLAIAWTGASGRTQGWPFACYPTFDRSPGRQMPGLAIAWVGEDGAEHPVPMDRWSDPEDTQRLWGEVWRTSGVRGPLQPDGLERLWQRIAARNGLDRARSVRFYRAILDVTPRTGGWSYQVREKSRTVEGGSRGCCTARRWTPPGGVWGKGPSPAGRPDLVSVGTLLYTLDLDPPRP